MSFVQFYVAAFALIGIGATMFALASFQMQREGPPDREAFFIGVGCVLTPWAVIGLSWWLLP